MVDAHVSGACVERHAGSSPVLGTIIAEIAQLVEHNLAKVRVASSSLVFRSFKAARMVESVDTRDLKSLGHCGCAGSSPASRTKRKETSERMSLFFWCGTFASQKWSPAGG